MRAFNQLCFYLDMAFCNSEKNANQYLLAFQNKQNGSNVTTFYLHLCLLALTKIHYKGKDHSFHEVEVLIWASTFFNNK